MGPLRYLLLVLLLLLLGGSTAFGQSITPASPVAVVAAPTPLAEIEEIQKKQAELREEVSLAQGRAETFASRNSSVPEDVLKELELLSRLSGLLEQQGGEIQERSKLLEEGRIIGDVRAQIRDGIVGEKGIDPFSLSERILGDLLGEEEREERLATSIKDVTRALESAQSEFADKDAKRRLAKEGITLSEGGDAEALNPALRRAQLEARVAEEGVRFAQYQLDNERLSFELHQQRLQNLRDQITLLKPRARLTERALGRRLEKIEKQEALLNRDIESARLEVGAAEKRYAQVKDRYEVASENDPSIALEVEARKVVLEAAQARVTAIGGALSSLQSEKEVWKRRFRVQSSKVPQRELRHWQEELAAAMEKSEGEGRLRSSRIDDLKKSAAALEEKIAAESSQNSERLRWFKEQQRGLSDYKARLEEEERDAASLALLRRKLGAEISEHLNTFNPLDLLSDIWDGALSLWRYELFATSDDFPITIGKILSGFVLVVLGYFFSRFLSAHVVRKFLSRFRLSRGAVSALQSLVFYMLVITFALCALRVVNIPLTVFTVIGGALAIGVGFGSQNIVSNFISGLIVLIEGRVRVGDIVEGDGISGIVSEIGTRSTRIRRHDNTDIIVPNSILLEKNLTNWTLLDPVVRLSVHLVVPQSASPVQVKELLLQAAREHGRVLPIPEPVVLFTEISPSGFSFELLLWVKVVTPLDTRLVQSEIRFRIETLFRESGVPLAPAPLREYTVKMSS